MSAQPLENVPTLGGDEDRGPGNELTASPEPVEVRRNGAVSAVIGAAASAIAIAYLWRATETGAALDWLLCVVLAVTAVGFLRSLLDGRAPLLVADEMGVRTRFGDQWRGLPWEAIEKVVVQPRKGLLHDGRLVVSLHHVQRAAEGLEGRALRAARLNQKVYGAAIAVPLGITTRVTGEGDLGDRVAALSQGRAEVVTLLATPGDPVRAEEVALAPPAAPVVPEQSAPEVEERPVIVDDAEPVTERRPRWLRRSADRAPVEERTGDEGDEPAGAVARTEDDDSTGHTAPLRVIDADAPAVHRSGKVRAIARIGEPVAPLVIEDFEPEPAYDPVIGPELAAARNRVGLSVDELAERTRIRPHVIESIEVDDFTPCGGDFYARGHIRTLARVLGKDPAPMLAQFEARYATAPVNARRVFEAELATGMHGSIRSTYGGPNWALLIGLVLTLVLVWSGVRLFAGDGEELLQTPPPVLNGSGGLSNAYGEPPKRQVGPQPVPTTLTAVDASAHVEVRDKDGELVFEGDLVIGEVKRVEVLPPITVSSDNGGAVSVIVGQQDMGFLGEPDEPATQVFQRP
ncbi:helix-turn-helix domain-containing protein [Nocardioides caldifontis]|uniref:helix-turn-helix domain-containing protein n=1 Tax=Nocardioides caldifontis TaxID=2588938 RepID=UPI0011E052F0|nr:RodZ domain-containing protein [Nocardioides caldifontis]